MIRLSELTRSRSLSRTARPGWRSALAAATLLLGACGGGGGGDRPPSAPRLQVVLPPDGARDVGLDAVPSAAFDADLDPRSIHGQSVLLSHAVSGAVAGTVRYERGLRTIQFAPDGGLLPGSEYSFELTAEVRSELGAQIEPREFRFHTAELLRPRMTSADPADGAADVAPGVAPSVTFDLPLEPATVHDESVELEGTAGFVRGTVAYVGSANKVKFAPDADLDQGAQYTLRLTSDILGTNGVSIEAVAVSFTIAVGDQSQPRIVATVPKQGATDVPPGSVPTVVFDSALDGGTVGAGSVSLHGPSGSVSGTPAYVPAKRAIKFFPAAELETSSAYTLRLTADITGANGVAIDPFALHFTTASGPPPRVVSTDPTDGETEVPLDVRPAVTFDSDLDPLTVHGGSVSLHGPGGAVAGDELYDPASRTVRFVPSALLDAESDYTLVLTDDIEGADGVPFAGMSLGFRTLSRPKIVFVTPGDADVDVERDARIEVHFDRRLDPTSISEDTIELFDDGRRVDAPVTLQPGDRVVHMQAADAMGMLRPMKIRVKATVKSEDGIHLGDRYHFYFTTKDGEWGTSSEVARSSDPAFASPDVALSHNGEATAVLLDTQGGDVVHGVRYEPDAPFPWQSSEAIDARADSSEAHVAASDFGRAIAVWRNGPYVFYNRYNAGWLAAGTQLSRDGTLANEPRIAMTPDGRALAAWLREDEVSGTYNIEYATYQSGSWGFVQTVLDLDQDQPLRELRLGMDANGDAVVAFTMSVEGQYRIFAARAEWDRDFDNARPVDDIELSRDDAIDITLAVAGGVALASWVQDSQSCPSCGDWRNRLWANRLDLSGPAWDGPELIDETGELSSFQPAAALSEDGSRGMVIWRQDAQVGRDKLGAHSIDTTVPLALGLGTPVLLDTGTESAFPNAKPKDMQVALDGSGNGVAVYRLESSAEVFDVVGRRFARDLWSSAQRIETLVASAAAPELSMERSGAAMVIWHAYSPGQPARVEANLFE